METPDYYAILNVRPGASVQEISRAYRVLLRRHHPDMENHDGGAPADPALLQEAMTAYSVLSDPERRDDYDRSRQERRPPAAAPKRSPAGPSVVAGPIVIAGPVIVGPVRREGQRETPATPLPGHPQLTLRQWQHRLLERRLLDALRYRNRW